MFKIMKVLACVVAVLFCIGFCASLSKNNKTTYTPKTGQEVKQTEAPKESQKEACDLVKINDILSLYKDNEVKADLQYKNKCIEVTGSVDLIKKDFLDNMYVTLGTGAIFEIPVIQCHLNKEQEMTAANLTKGQKVTVKGRVDGLMMNVQLKDCVIQ
jgi:hypothetical protein